MHDATGIYYYARKQAEQLDNLNKDIRDLKNKIDAEQAKLNHYLPKDSTQH